MTSFSNNNNNNNVNPSYTHNHMIKINHIFTPLSGEQVWVCSLLFISHNFKSWEITKVKINETCNIENLIYNLLKIIVILL